MKFGEECFKHEPDLPSPFLKVRYRDDLSFTGYHIPYVDYTKFVMYNDTILPLFMMKEVPEDAVMFDAANFLAIGAVEVLGTFYGYGENRLLDFDDDLLNDALLSHEDTTKLKEHLNNYYLCESTKSTNNDELSLILAMRTPYSDERRPVLSQVINHMLLVHLTNDRLFCEALISTFSKGLSLTGPYIMPFVTVLAVKGGLSLGALTGSAISYKAPSSGKRYCITDCRGLGVYCYSLLLICTYLKFADFRGVKPFKGEMEDIVPYVQKLLIDCIGDDVVGSYCKTGVIRCGLTGAKDYALCRAIRQRPPYNMKTRFEVDGVKVPREIYENVILYKRANHVTLEEPYSSHRDLSSVYYVNFQSLYDGALALTNLNESIPTVEDKTSDAERALMSEIESKDKIISVLRTKNEELLKQIDEVKSSYENSEKIEIAHLNNQLEVKSDIISSLREEIEVLECELRNHYLEEDLENILIPELDESISLQEMIGFLNDYRLVMVGGRIDLILKLQQLGLTNVVQIDGEHFTNNTPISGDFYCFNTKFLAHKLVRAVQSVYGDASSQMYYFNGTNPESLVRVSYAFIMNWLNS